MQPSEGPGMEEEGRTTRRRLGRWVDADAGGRTERLVRLAAVVWLAVGCVALAWVGWRLLWPVLAVIGPPLLMAGLVVHALEPLVGRLARTRLPRWAATAVVYVGLLLVLAGLAAAAAPLVGHQAGRLAEEFPDLRARAQELLEQGFGAVGIELQLRPEAGGEEIAREVADEAEQALEDDVTRDRLAGVLGGLAGAAAGTARLLVLLLLGPVIAFYLLSDLPRVRRALRGLLPPERRDDIAELAGAVGRVAGGYVRGQLIIAAIVGLAMTAGFFLVDLPFYALVGTIAGVTNLVPFVGPVVGGLLGVAVALLSGGGFALAAAVLLVVVVVQQVESQVLQPLIMGRTVQIHPAIVLLAVVVGGGLFGVVGLLLAVPVVAAGKVVAAHLWARHVPWTIGGGPPAPEEVEGARIPPVTEEA